MIRNIAVCVKEVIDTGVGIRIDDGTGDIIRTPDTIMNPYDEHAIEEALIIRERLKNEPRVTLVSLGCGGTDAILRAGLAMGADRAIILDHSEYLNGYLKARTLAEMMSPFAPEIILCGKKSIDSGSEQIPQMLAELMSFPHVTYVEKTELNDATIGSITIRRKLPSGEKAVVTAPLPVVLSMEKGNTPRYPTLPEIMKAQKKEIVRLRPDIVPLVKPEKKPNKIIYRRQECGRNPKIAELIDEETIRDVVAILQAHSRVNVA